MGDGPRGWRARATSRLRPEDPIELSLTERGDNAPRCSYYRSDDGAALRACPGCELTLHVTCWRELGACPTIGCAVTASEPFTGGPSLDALISQALEEAGCCAACQGAPRPGDPLWDCYACGLSRHVSCWRADKICQTQGCDVALRDMTHGRGRPDAVLSAGPRASARGAPRALRNPVPWALGALVLVWVHALYSLISPDGIGGASPAGISAPHLAALLLFALGVYALRGHPWFERTLSLGLLAEAGGRYGRRIREAHPEASFGELAGTLGGIAAALALLLILGVLAGAGLGKLGLRGDDQA